MYEELYDSKMFWLIFAIVLAYLCGTIIKRITGSKHTSAVLSLPFLAIGITILSVLFVKLNVAYYKTVYTAAGIAGGALVAVVLGYFLYQANDKKTPVWMSILFMFCALQMVLFYVFYKNIQKINISECPPQTDIYLLLKKEDAGYFEVNEWGIGYVGQTLFTDGFRPVFERNGISSGDFDPIPYAVEIHSASGKLHALQFHARTRKEGGLPIDSLIQIGKVKPDELKTGDLVK